MAQPRSFQPTRHAWGNAEPSIQADAKSKLPPSKASSVQIANQQGGRIGAPSRRLNGLAALSWIGTYVAVTKKAKQPWWVGLLAASAVSKIVRG